MSWLQEASPRRGWRDDRPVAQRFEEDVLLVPRDLDTGRVEGDTDPEDGQKWVTAHASYASMGHVLDHVQVRGSTLRSRIPNTVGIRFRPTERAWDEVTIRWPKSTPAMEVEE